MEISSKNVSSKMITNIDAIIKYNTRDLYLDVLNRQSVDTKAVSAFYSEKDLRLIAYEENKIKQTITN